MSRRVIPFSRRPADIAIVAFFLVNILFITYIVDIEQLVIANPAHFTYPLWPPKPVIDAVHWWGYSFDPLLIARPVFFKVTIWLDNLFYGPFYAVAIYAYSTGKAWIRLPSLIWAVSMASGVIMILSEEAFGQFRTSHFAIVALANASWIVFPLIVLIRMGGTAHPFARPSAKVPA